MNDTDFFQIRAADAGGGTTDEEFGLSVQKASELFDLPVHDVNTHPMCYAERDCIGANLFGSGGNFFSG